MNVSRVQTIGMKVSRIPDDVSSRRKTNEEITDGSLATLYFDQSRLHQWRMHCRPSI
jgi:hypothetical protein